MGYDQHRSMTLSLNRGTLRNVTHRILGIAFFSLSTLAGERRLAPAERTRLHVRRLIATHDERVTVTRAQVP